jgi:hypothetical protein
MAMQTPLLGSLLGLLSATVLSWSAGAVTIYDNSGNDLVTRLNPGLKEIGDEIIFAGTERYVTQFDFEYYGLNSANSLLFSGNVEARVRFYLNDGPTFNTYATPGTVLFDSGWFGGFGPTPRNTLVFASVLGDFPVNGLFIPANSITWSVQFQGLGPTDELGVDIYNPILVGSSFNDYWENNGGTWTALNGNVPMNFAARFQATVPEPSSFSLLLLAGGAVLAKRRARA